MATAHPKPRRSIDPATPFHEMPGDLLLTTARRLGELGFTAGLAATIRQPENAENVREAIVRLGAETGLPQMWLKMLQVMSDAHERREGFQAPRPRPRLLHPRYTPIEQQVRNLHAWNKRYGWGLPKGWVERLDVP